MSDSTFHTTREDIRKAESKLSQANDGNVPASSEVAQMKVRRVFGSSTMQTFPVLSCKLSSM